MKNSLLALTLGLSLPVNASSKNNIQIVKIKVVTDFPLSDLDTIFITGSNDQIGQWNGRGIPFIRKDSLRWSLNFRQSRQCIFIQNNSRHMAKRGAY